MKIIDVLWFVQHISREMDVACAVKYYLETEHDIKVDIKHIYHDVPGILKEYKPRMAVFPFFYNSSDLAIGDYIKQWKNTIFFNLAWEEIYYKTQADIKTPADDFTKKMVIHQAWGQFFEDYLLFYGVNKKNIFLNGQPAYQLYREPYCCYYKQRDQLAREYHLNVDKKWIFIPENYRWAFFSDGKLKNMSANGNLQEMIELRDFCKASLVKLYQWCAKASMLGEFEVIFRPRPATNSSEIKAFLDDNAKCAHGDLHIMKNESVREWIMASDVVISSYSTSLIEAAIAGKPAYMIEPIDIPHALFCDWYNYAPRIKNSEEFMAACYGKHEAENSDDLRDWAESQMLSRGDPIKNLAGFVSDMLKGQAKTIKPTSNYTNLLRVLLNQINPLNRRPYFNKATHENDVFSERDVLEKVDKWRRIFEKVD